VVAILACNMTPAALYHANTRLAHWLANRFARSNRSRLATAGIEAHDVDQVALLALHVAATEYTARRGDFGAFAATVIRNALTGLARQMARSRVAILPIFDVQDEDGEHVDGLAIVPDRGPGPADLAERREEIRIVRAALRRLRDPQRRAIMGRMRGHSIQAI